MRRLLPLLLPVALVATGCLLALSAETDRERYAVGDDGTATFRNGGRVEVFLEGCSSFVHEQLDQGTWVPRWPEVVCVWEGFARPVAPGASLVEPFSLRGDAGTWRLSYRVGLACNPDRPLSEADCDSILEVTTQPFTVQDSCEPQACGPELGMPNRLCPDGVNVAGPTGRCLRDPALDVCGWEIATCPGEGR